LNELPTGEKVRKKVNSAMGGQKKSMKLEGKGKVGRSSFQ